MAYHIAILPGDGIGPEIIAAAMDVLNKVTVTFDLPLEISLYPFGGHGIDAEGSPFPDATKAACLSSDAILLGAIGGPRWDHLPGPMRPESGLLALRKSLEVYANLRPAVLMPSLIKLCPLKSDLLERGFDLMVVRELTGGIYFGEKGRDASEPGNERAYDIEAYSEMEIRRIAHRAFKLARERRKLLVSIDKANVLESSKLWRALVTEIGKSYPDVTLSHMYVDNAAMQLILNPTQFDVILTSNLFGDILSDEASVLTGSIGLLPSASLGEGHRGLYEPIHGSAPDIAGKNIANPIGTIKSVAMLLRMSLGMDSAAKAIEDAVSETLSAGYRTQDLYLNNGETKANAVESKVLGTAEMGREIAARIRRDH